MFIFNALYIRKTFILPFKPQIYQVNEEPSEAFFSVEIPFLRKIAKD